MTIEEAIRTHILADTGVTDITEEYTPYYLPQTDENTIEAPEAIVVRMGKQSGSEMQGGRLVTAEMQVFCFAPLKDVSLALSEAVRVAIDRKRFGMVDFVLWQSDDDGYDEPLRAYYQMAMYQVSYFQ